MATVAVFLALGGTSYAFSKGAIGTREIRDNSIRSRDVADGKLKAMDFAPGQLPTGDPHGESGHRAHRGAMPRSCSSRSGDNGGGTAATISYASGVTAIEDPASAGTYIVTFDRSVKGCVAQVTPGFGDPSGGGGGADWAMPLVAMFYGGADDVGIVFQDETGTQIDTAFLVTAFC